MVHVKTARTALHTRYGKARGAKAALNQRMTELVREIDSGADQLIPLAEIERKYKAARG
jgi:hypothetical protein